MGSEFDVYLTGFQRNLSVELFQEWFSYKSFSRLLPSHESTVVEPNGDIVGKVEHQALLRRQAHR